MTTIAQVTNLDVPRQTASHRKISEFMTLNPTVINDRTLLEEAVAVMDELSTRHLPVSDGHRLVGILSDRDVARARLKYPSASLIVSDAMTKYPYCVSPEADMADVLRTMASNKLGCVVIKGVGERILGVFTTTDALFLMAECLDQWGNR